MHGCVRAPQLSRSVSRTEGDVIKNIATIVAASGWVLWAASLATPVAVIEKGRFLGLHSAPEVVIRGWDIIRTSVHGVADLWNDPGDIFIVLLGLGNVVMGACPFALFTRHPRLRQVVGLAAAAETLAIASVYVLAQGWVWAGPGYWLWLSSFILISASLALASRASRQEVVREPAG